MTIFSNGWWFVLVSHETTNSDVFIFYLKKMNSWFAKNHNFEHKKIILSIDNWHYHKSKRSIELMKSFNWRVFFLSVYSPSLAQIELAFAFLKKHLANKWKKDHLNLKARGSKQSILKEIMKLTKPKILKLFKHFFSEIQLNLNLSS